MEILELKNKNTKIYRWQKKEINKTEDRAMDITQPKLQRENLPKREKLKLRYPGGSLKRFNIYAIGVRENGNRHSTENIFEEIMTKFSIWWNI